MTQLSKLKPVIKKYLIEIISPEARIIFTKKSFLIFLKLETAKKINKCGITSLRAKLKSTMFKIPKHNERKKKKINDLFSLSFLIGQVNIKLIKPSKIINSGILKLSGVELLKVEYVINVMNKLISALFENSFKIIQLPLQLKI